MLFFINRRLKALFRHISSVLTQIHRFKTNTKWIIKSKCYRHNAISQYRMGGFNLTIRLFFLFIVCTWTKTTTSVVFLRHRKRMDFKNKFLLMFSFSFSFRAVLSHPFSLFLSLFLSLSLPLSLPLVSKYEGSFRAINRVWFIGMKLKEFLNLKHRHLPTHILYLDSGCCLVLVSLFNGKKWESQWNTIQWYLSLELDLFCVVHPHVCDDVKSRKRMRKKTRANYFPLVHAVDRGECNYNNASSDAVKMAWATAHTKNWNHSWKFSFVSASNAKYNGKLESGFNNNNSLFFFFRLKN